MRIFAVIGLLLITSCASINQFSQKVDFLQKLQDHTEISHNARKANEKIDGVELVKIDLKDLPKVIKRIKDGLGGYGAIAITRISTDEPFVVYEDVLKDFAKSNQSNFVVYFEAKDVLRYDFNKARYAKVDDKYNVVEESEKLSLKTVERKGNTVFEAYFFAEIEYDVIKTIQIE